MKPRPNLRSVQFPPKPREPENIVFRGTQQPQPYRPARRISAKRERGIWSWRGTAAERLRAWTWEHKILSDLVIMAILSIGIFCALWWLLDVQGAVRR